MTDVALLPTVVEEIRVCNKCGESKPLDQFRLVNGKYRIRICDVCRKAQMIDYHHRTWDERYARDQEIRKQRTKEFIQKQTASNMALYGSRLSPEQRIEDQRRRAESRRKIKEATGFTKSAKSRARDAERIWEQRVNALTMYGGKCECCGETRLELLTFDHMQENLPSKESRKLRGEMLVHEVVREYAEHGYPNNKFRILCWNCNLSRGFYGYCPHKTDRKDYLKSIETTTIWATKISTKRSWNLKTQAIEAYGGKCTLCGESRSEFLTIDHINGGGNRHRKAIKISIYQWLKNNKYPVNGFRLLCMNCNCNVRLEKNTAKRS